ncbi:hypothetical protein IAQ61_003418 [Plenodomus lingam]|nr:hypothetical protein IAQ61_003418 [Plenodomus lingam]
MCKQSNGALVLQENNGPWPDAVKVIARKYVWDKVSPPRTPVFPPIDGPERHARPPVTATFGQDHDEMCGDGDLTTLCQDVEKPGKMRGKLDSGDRL